MSLSFLLHFVFIFGFAFWQSDLHIRPQPPVVIPIEFLTIDKETIISEQPSEGEAPVQAEEVAVREQKPAPAPVPIEDAIPIPEPDIIEAPVADKPVETAPQSSQAIEETPPEFVTTTPIILPRPVPIQKPEIVKAEPESLDLTRIAALLNKIPEAVEDIAKADEDTQSEGAQALAVSEIDAFRAQIQKCWSIPAGARDSENLVIQIRLGLNRDGSIAQGPFVLDTQNRRGDPFYRAAAESVLRAVHQCQPFQMPVEKYALWRDIELTFNPQQMLEQR